MDRDQYWEYLREKFSCVTLAPQKFDKEGKEINDGKTCFTKGWDERTVEKIDIGPHQPGYGVGIVTGPASGISVIDVDNMPVFLPKAEKVGWDWTPYYRVRTASGKMHIHFKFDPKTVDLCRDKKRFEWLKAEWGIELLVYNTISISLATINGNEYFLEHDGPVLEELPDVLMNDIAEVANSREVQELSRVNGPPNLRSIEQILEDTARAFPLNQEGSRHDNLLKVTNIYCRDYIGDYIEDADIFEEYVQFISTQPAHEVSRDIERFILYAITQGIEPNNIFRNETR